jgi:hypothetical protein
LTIEAEIWTTNPLERLNMELKRRCRVVRIFRNDTVLVRLAGAVLIDMHEQWIDAERRYFSEASMANLHPERDDGDAVAGTGDHASIPLHVAARDQGLQRPPPRRGRVPMSARRNTRAGASRGRRTRKRQQPLTARLE